MVKNIPVAQLRLGMYIHDLNCGWMDHPFARNQFRIEDRATLDKILSLGIEEVYIDTEQGILLKEAESDAPASTGSR